MHSHALQTDVQLVRAQVHAHVDDDAATASQVADRETTIELLNDALATKLVCVLRCRRHHFMARAINLQNAAQKFMTHANAELSHADQLAGRIVQLGGAPDFSPQQLIERSHVKYGVGKTLASMIREDLEAKAIAIDSYRSTLQYLGENDPTTRHLLEYIVAAEEEHADTLANLLVAPRG